MKSKLMSKPLTIISRLTKIRKKINGEEEYKRDWHGFYRDLLEIIILTEKRLADSIENEQMKNVFLERLELIKMWENTTKERFQYFLKSYPIHEVVELNENK